MPLVRVPLVRADCRTCIGLGELGDETRCPTCNGSGTKQTAKAATVVNPARDGREMPRPRRGGRRPSDVNKTD